MRNPAESSRHAVAVLQLTGRSSFPFSFCWPPLPTYYCRKRHCWFGCQPKVARVWTWRKYRKMAAQRKGRQFGAIGSRGRGHHHYYPMPNPTSGRQADYLKKSRRLRLIKRVWHYIYIYNQSELNSIQLRLSQECNTKSMKEADSVGAYGVWLGTIDWKTI